MEILRLRAVVNVTVAHGEIATINVQVVSGRTRGGVGVAVRIKFTMFDRNLAVLCPACEAIVILEKYTVLQVQVCGAVVVTNAGGVEGGGAAMFEDHAGDAIIFCAAELPSSAPPVAGGIASGSILNQGRAKIPHRWIGRILSTNDNRIRDCSLARQIDAKGICTR